MYSLRASVEIIVASLLFKHLRMLLLQRVGRLSRLKEEWSCSWRFWTDVQGFRGTEHTNSQYFLAWMSPCIWPHLPLNDGSSKPVCLFTTWLGKELSFAKITLPDFSFKLRIEQGRKLKHIKAENICSEKFAHYSPAFWLCRLRWLTAVSQVR